MEFQILDGRSFDNIMTNYISSNKLGLHVNGDGILILDGFIFLSNHNWTNDDFIILAVDNGELVGAISYCFSNNQGFSIIHPCLGFVDVRVDRRKQGIATRLIEQMSKMPDMHNSYLEITLVSALGKKAKLVQICKRYFKEVRYTG